MGSIAEEQSSRDGANPPADGSWSSFYLNKAFRSVEEFTPWIDEAVRQAELAKNAAQETAESFFSTARLRLVQIQSTSSSHFQQTVESLKDIKGEFDAYEDKFIGKLKEGVIIATSNPLATTGAVVSLGFLVLKGPRQSIYRKISRVFVSEEALLSKYDARVKEMRQSFERLKIEREKWEKQASLAEEEMKRGRTKLRQAGNQIQRAISSAHKIERQAKGLKDALGELPRVEASRFRSQVSNLVSQTKQERNALTKEVTKISNYGISV